MNRTQKVSQLWSSCYHCKFWADLLPVYKIALDTALPLFTQWTRCRPILCTNVRKQNVWNQNAEVMHHFCAFIMLFWDLALMNCGHVSGNVSVFFFLQKKIVHSLIAKLMLQGGVPYLTLPCKMWSLSYHKHCVPLR